MATKDLNTLALEAAKKAGGTAYTPSDSVVSSWMSSFVPGISTEYTNYFDTLIKAATQEYGAKSPEVARYNALKAVFNEWRKVNPSIDDVNLSASGGKTRSDLRKQVENVKSTITSQTKAIADAASKYEGITTGTSAKGKLSTDLAGATKGYDTAYTNLYGAANKGWDKDKPLANSLQGQLNSKLAAIDTAKANLAANTNPKNATKLATAVTNAMADVYGKGGTQNKPTAGSLYDKYNTAVKSLADTTTSRTAAQTAYDTATKDKDTTLKSLDDIVYNALDVYKQAAYDPYNAFLTNTKTPNPAATEAEKIASGVEYYNKYGSMDPNLDPKLVSGVQSQVDKAKQDATAAAYAAKYSSATDLAGALNDYATAYKLPDPVKNKDLYTKVIQSIASGVDTPTKLQAKADADAAAKVKADQDAADAAAAAKVPTTPVTPAVPTTPTVPTTPNKPNISTQEVVDYLNSLTGNKGTLDINGLISYLTGAGAQPKPGETVPAINPTPTPTVSTPITPTPVVNPTPKKDVGTLGFTLPSNYTGRSAVQDVASTYEAMHPRAYATGQFDPFYSGVLSGGAPYSQVPSAMTSQGTFAGGAGYTTPSTVGFGFQNAYVPTGAAAGGYMDAQTIGQQNQALQQQQAMPAPQSKNSFSLGLGAIPNMTQYTNYTSNPGITSTIENADDGSVGGVPVPGQTNPVW